MSFNCNVSLNITEMLFGESSATYPTMIGIIEKRWKTLFSYDMRGLLTNLLRNDICQQYVLGYSINQFSPW